MNYYQPLIPLIAASDDFFERIGQAMRNAGNRVELSSLSIFMLIPLILAGIYAARYIYKSLFKHNYEAPSILFMQLCTAHGLTRKERRSLRRAAARWQVSDPSLLFIDPQLWKFDDQIRQVAPSSLKRKDYEMFNLLSLYSRVLRTEEVEKV